METPNYVITFTQDYRVGKINYDTMRYLPLYEGPTITFYPMQLPLDLAEEHRVA